MKRILYCDTETFSEIPISNGTYVYAENAEVMLFAYAFDDEPVRVWDRTANPIMPEDLHIGLLDKDTIKVWHNSMFDRNILKYSLGIDMPPETIHDTMVIALLHGLPGGLDKLCQIFKLDVDEAKSKEGRRLILKFCKPTPKNMKLRRYTRETSSHSWAEFVEYAKSDITAMRNIYHKLPKWNFIEEEKQLWYLDQLINDRGFLVDVQTAQKAIEAINNTQKMLANKTQKLTKDKVDAATQVERVIQYTCDTYGITLPDLQKSTVERRINDPDTPDGLRELLAIRLDASTTSTSKYKKLISGVNSDNRLRGTLQFSGASRTRRWAGRTFQPQNLPRPTHSQEQIDEAIMYLNNDCLDLVSDDVMKLTSSVIRGCIVAPAYKKFVVSDLSNIEGRVAAWLANEEWKIKAFEDFDKGKGADIYTLAYAKSFNKPVESVDSERRQLGKVQELALGYGGGVGAYLTMAMTYRMNLYEMARAVIDTIPAHIKIEAEKFYELQKRKQGSVLKSGRSINHNIFVVCDSLKRMWRTGQPNIAAYWYQLEDAMKSAINNPGCKRYANNIYFLKQGSWVRMVLPSGRSICYPSAQIDKDGGLTYFGINPYTRVWERLHTYGGKLFENACQSLSRDVMANNMMAAEEAGYNIILTVHDELITETKETPKYTAEGLSKILSTVPDWAKGLPLAASGYEGYRYKK